MSAPVREMRRSYLVQRLNAPRSMDNPFSFGGGMRNGGLSDEAMDLLRGIFSFDYMGAAEFEFGAVPKALNNIVSQADSLRAFEVKTPSGVVLAVAPQQWETEVGKRIRSWATGKEDGKESTRLSRALDPQGEHDSRTQGWLELDNGFAFFVNREMWAKFCALFGVEVAS